MIPNSKQVKRKNKSNLMTLLLKNDKNHFYIIDHVAYINKLYIQVKTKECNNVSYQLMTKLFSIIGNIKTKHKRKRIHCSQSLHEETYKVKELYQKFVSNIPENLKSEIETKYNILSTSQVKDLAKNLFETTTFKQERISGGNISDVSLKCTVNNEDFLIPPKSRFLCGCVKEQCRKLDGSKFDIIIADPPWWNKYIRRLKNANEKLSYSMMYNEDIASIPVKNLIAPNCLVIVWCTNSPSNIAAVKEKIFPSWGVDYVATWYWLKVTVDLEPVCPFGVDGIKQPYERVIVGKVGEVKNIPECMLLVSIPSALHSHKPPLLDLLKQFVNVENPQVLELFARYLLPNTTSVGFEPLKWQHISLYEVVN